MSRTSLALFLLLLAAPAFAQDMPLSQVLIDGEGWKLLKPLDGMPVNGFPKTKAGIIYEINSDEKAVYAKDVKILEQKGRKLAEGFVQPTGLAMSPDGGTLVVADAAGKHLYAFRVEKDGSLTCKEPYYALRLPNGQKASGAGRMCFDSAGRLYVASTVGVQIFDPTGRLCGVLLNPSRTPPRDVVLVSNEDGSGTLYIDCGKQGFERKIKANDGVGKKKSAEK